MNFNINHEVEVQLTPLGRRLLREKYNAKRAWGAVEYQPPTEDAEGWSRWQLWELMAQLGPHMSMGMSLVIRTTIRIPDDPERV